MIVTAAHCLTDLNPLKQAWIVESRVRMMMRRDGAEEPPVILSSDQLQSRFFCLVDEMIITTKTKKNEYHRHNS